MQKWDWGDVFERAAWTFVQGALGSFTVIPFTVDVGEWKAVGLAALTGGISALLSFVKTLIRQRVQSDAV